MSCTNSKNAGERYSRKQCQGNKKCDGDILLRFTPKNPFFEIVSKKSTRNEYA